MFFSLKEVLACSFIDLDLICQYCIDWISLKVCRTEIKHCSCSSKIGKSLKLQKFNLRKTKKWLRFQRKFKKKWRLKHAFWWSCMFSWEINCHQLHLWTSTMLLTNKSTGRQSCTILLFPILTELYEACQIWLQVQMSKQKWLR